jgi:hypothetical protein
MNRHTCIRESVMKRIFAPSSKIILAVGVLVFTVVLGAGAALAQSGHFVGDVTCTDEGTTLQCCGKVAGLGSTTFEITVEGATATASVVCRNPAGNIAPGQSFTFEPTGTTGVRQTPRSGQFQFCIDTIAPTAPADSCPNNKWTATVTDVEFTTATVTLFEGTGASRVQSDQLTGLSVGE